MSPTSSNHYPVVTDSRFCWRALTRSIIIACAANKAAANYRKHKVSFDEALTVFGDPLVAIFDDTSHSVDEDREIIIGHSNRNRILLVCFTEHKKEAIRLFSARRATKKEKADYEENASF